MAYLDDIPNPEDIQATSQGQIKENFGQLETQYSVDHDSLLAAGASGKHLKVTMPEVTSDPATSEDEGALYTKDSGTQPELFYREELSGDSVQLTERGYAISFIKAFVSFSGAGVIAGTALNVTSVTRTGGGRYTINLTTALDDADYLVIGNCNSTDIRLWTVQNYAKSNNSCSVITCNSGTPQDVSTDLIIIRVA